jgi:hypothetical protein
MHDSINDETIKLKLCCLVHISSSEMSMDEWIKWLIIIHINNNEEKTFQRFSTNQRTAALKYEYNLAFKQKILF